MNPPFREVAKGAFKRLRLDSLQALALILVISISAVTILYAVSSERPAAKPSPPVSPTGTSYSLKLTVSGSPSMNDNQNNSIWNGDFSNGLANWTAVKVISTGISGEFPIFAVVNNTSSSSACVPIERRDNPSLRIEAPFGANGYVKQQITLPGSGTRLSFLSWGWEGYGPQFQYSGLVNAYVSIVDSNGVVHTLETYTPPPMFIPGAGNSPDVCTGNSPVLKSYDLSAFAGQKVELRLGVTSENCCGADGFFDDVQVTTLPLTQASTFVITPSGSSGYCPCNSSTSRAGIRIYADGGLQRLIPDSIDVGEFHPGDQVVLYLWVTNTGNNATLSWSSNISANATGIGDSWVWTNDGQTWRGLTGYALGGVVATMYIIHISTLTPPGTYGWTLTLQES